MNPACPTIFVVHVHATNVELWQCTVRSTYLSRSLIRLIDRYCCIALGRVVVLLSRIAQLWLYSSTADDIDGAVLVHAIFTVMTTAS